MCVLISFFKIQYIPLHCKYRLYQTKLVCYKLTFLFRRSRSLTMQIPFLVAFTKISQYYWYQQNIDVKIYMSRNIIFKSFSRIWWFCWPSSLLKENAHVSVVVGGGYRFLIKATWAVFLRILFCYKTLLVC